MLPKWLIVSLFTLGFVLTATIFLGYSDTFGFQLKHYFALPPIAIVCFLGVRKCYDGLSLIVFHLTVRIWFSWISVFLTLTSIVILHYLSNNSEHGLFHFESFSSWGDSTSYLFVDRSVAFIAALNLLYGMFFTFLVHKNYTDLAITTIIPPMLVIIFLLHIMHNATGFGYPELGG